MIQLINYIKESKKFNALFGVNKKHDSFEAIDLGLSVKWASCNVGATKPEEYGLLFQWGRTDGYEYDSTLGTTFEAEDGLVKTTVAPTTTSGKEYKKGDILDLADDAAHTNMKGSWRMPTQAEIQELLDNTTNKWTNENGIYGCKFTSKKDDNKWIFIPAAGCFKGYIGEFKHIDKLGSIWSSSASSDNAYCAYQLYFHYSNCADNDCGNYYGYSVRGVCK